MVHICYIRKQISIYLKLIFLSTVVVFSFSMVFSVTDEETTKKSSNQHPKIITYDNIGRKSYFSQLRQRLENMKEITKKMFREDSVTNRMGKVNLHRWFGLCGLNVETLRQYALFPRHPNHRTTAYDLQVNLRLVNIGQRIFGYIHPPFTSKYQFGISSDDFSELWISNDHDPRNISLAAKVGGLIGDQYVVGWTSPGEYSKYPMQVSPRMVLEEGKKYYFEILHKQAKGNGHIEVAWNATGFPKLAIVTREFLSMYLEEVDQSVIRAAVVQDNQGDIPLDLPNHKKQHRHENLPKKNHTIRTFINTKDVDNLFPTCEYYPSYVARNETIPRYTGVWRTRFSSVYPLDVDGEKMVLCKDANSDVDCKGNLPLNKTEVKMVVLRVMKALEEKHPRKYSLKDIVSMESNNDPANGVRYFVELELEERKTKKLVRFSRYVYHLASNDSLCYPKGLHWNPSETVYFIVTVKNQGRWLKHFIDNMVSIYRETKDENIHVIIADFNSKDVIVEDYLRNSGLPKYTVVRMSGKFHKTKAINAAANIVKTNSIIFQVDLHLEIPSNIIEQARKHCIPGIMTYNPVLMRLMCGSTPEYPVGFWETNGYGLFAIYKADWERFGGMNVLEYKHKWGGEDWELVDRVLMAELEIERFKVPGLYHYFHPRRGMWNEA